MTQLIQPNEMMKPFSKILVEKVVEKKRDSMRAEEESISRDVNVAVFNVHVDLKNAQNYPERVDRVAHEDFYAIEKS